MRQPVQAVRTCRRLHPAASLRAVPVG